MAHELEDDFSHFEIKKNVCENCINYRDFNKGCWYYWDEKSACSQRILPNK